MERYNTENAETFLKKICPKMIFYKSAVDCNDFNIHNHDYVEFYVPYNGCGILKSENHGYVLKPGVVIKIKNGERHFISNIFEENGIFECYKFFPSK